MIFGPSIPKKRLENRTLNSHCVSHSEIRRNPDENERDVYQLSTGKTPISKNNNSSDKIRKWSLYR